jgi:hypothetical protein
VSERVYQARLIRRIQALFPGCIVLKNDSEFMPGIPDLTILHGSRWAMLEVKADVTSPTQPNQEYYVIGMNNLSFAAFIYPQNEEDVLNALQQSFGYH